MEQKTAELVQGTDLKDRKLKLTVTPTLVWNGTNPPDITATIEFSQDNDDTDPPMPGVVDPTTGKIDISDMPVNDKYTDNIDITIKLDASKMKNADGTKLTGKARWAEADEGPYQWNGTSGDLGFGWFCQMNASPPPLYNPIPPATIPNMTLTRKDDTTLEIDDNTPDNSPEYAFCVAFVLEGYNNYYISIDPILTTKNTGSNSFMLKN
ncbi:hypothetical protein [Erythrobacter mangrovi]|uniref:Uncharacterized protein n=1 Tax=Erythrobacter mangrovi TaxID=2739433 RepID=A0A7D3XBV1_9SPHN|nr:hypothetical protein [Erythrobacter mangrovi]QKG71890.1 hypothetical protein HQR01_11265 [Erythrobacter mangrovi]